MKRLIPVMVVLLSLSALAQQTPVKKIVEPEKPKKVLKNKQQGKKAPKATLSANQSTTKALTMNVVAGVSITTATLPSAFIGTAYTATITAAGGTPPYTWSITLGALPAGLTLAPTGIISGTPTAGCAVNPCAITLQVTDSSSTVSQIQLQWNAPVPTPASYNVLRGTVKGGPYSQVVNTATTSYVDKPVTHGVTYYYVAQSVATGGATSGFSNEAPAVFP